MLKFQGINGFATVYVDGKQVAYHENGFITWNVDITEEVCGKQTLSLAIDVDEESDIVSAYSHGGMLHSSWLYVLPEAYVNALYLSPLFDEDMETCSLRVDIDLANMPESIDGKGKIRSAEMAAGKEKGRLASAAVYKAEFALYDPNGIKTKEKSLVLDNKIKGYYTDQLYVANPVLWDAEHPRLYRFELILYKLDSISGTWEPLEQINKKVGLRKLERKGNRLFVNHNEVKLRGVCRHEISPRNGRALTNELIEQDVALFKEANCNYIRTSHYPPSEYFLDQCDEHGIYVEDELALAFIARTLPYTQRDPKETNRYLSHFAETMARDYNHPCVIIWSLCNESFGGHNFDLLNRFAHLKDPTRMTKFSYPMTIREEHEMPDIWSIHYSEYNADLAGKKDNLSVGGAPGKDMPVLHDEYVHVACYNREEMRRDPNIRSYWGESIRIFWDNIWNTEGALGGAIWAGIDETDLYDGGNGQMEWGIIDVWRRKKPEFYMTRKAYSPIKVIHSEVKAQEKKVLLIIENRFCHTNLNEVKVKWKCGDESGIWKLPECAPGKVIKVLLSLENAEDQSPVTLKFLDGNDCQIDEMKVFSRDYVEAPLFELSADETENIKALKIHKENQEVFITGNDFKFSFNVKTGLLTGGWARRNNKILVGGPILNVPYLKLGAWYMTSFAVKEKQNFCRSSNSGRI
ncbi:MAG: glycoside hydrolase family 2 protein [Ruminococcus sp.]